MRGISLLNGDLSPDNVNPESRNCRGQEKISKRIRRAHPEKKGVGCKEPLRKISRVGQHDRYSRDWHKTEKETLAVKQNEPASTLAAEKKDFEKQARGKRMLGAKSGVRAAMAKESRGDIRPIPRDKKD